MLVWKRSLLAVAVVVFSWAVVFGVVITCIEAVEATAGLLGW